MIRILALIFILLSLTGCSDRIDKKQAQYLMEVTVLKTGKSDCTVIESQDKTVLIDTANRDSARKITRYLKEKNIDTIDLLIISHFDKDHIGGFETIADRIDIKTVIQPDYKANTQTYRNYINALSKKPYNVINPKNDSVFNINDMEFKIYVPDTEYEKENNRSLITAITHGENSFLFAGDMVSERCSEIMQNNLKHYDYLKVPHHGIYFEGSDELYETISPQFAVITDNEEINTKKTDSIFNKLGTNVFHTKNGAVKIISNGKELKNLSNWEVLLYV